MICCISHNCTVDMKIQCISDALLRSHPSPLLSFLAPSVPIATWTTAAINRDSLASRLTQCTTRIRSLATQSSPLRAPTTAAAESEDDAPDTPSQDTANDTINDMLDFIPPGIRSDQPSQPDSRLNSSLPRESRESSADIMRRALERDRRSTSLLARRQGEIAARMEGLSYQEQNRNNLPALRPLPPPVRLDAFIGRSQNVDPQKGMDLSRALRSMEIKLAVNRVRADFNYQRFHERPGLKRKRLKSQRWRKRFKEGFKAVVGKVQDMRRRGW